MTSLPETLIAPPMHRRLARVAAALGRGLLYALVILGALLWRLGTGAFAQ